MVLVHDMLSECALQMYEILLKYLLRLSSYRADMILWQTDGRTLLHLDSCWVLTMLEKVAKKA